MWSSGGGIRCHTVMELSLSVFVCECVCLSVCLSVYLFVYSFVRVRVCESGRVWVWILTDHKCMPSYLETS